MFDPFSLGFLIGGLLTGVILGAIFGHVEAKRLRAEIDKSRRDCEQELRRLLDGQERKGGDPF
jgi:hypothetical protein